MKGHAGCCVLLRPGPQGPGGGCCCVGGGGAGGALWVCVLCGFRAGGAWDAVVEARDSNGGAREGLVSLLVAACGR